MTAQLFQSSFPEEYPVLKCQQESQKYGSRIIFQLFILEKTKKAPETLSDLYTALFTIQRFKKILTEEYIKKFNTSSSLIDSNFSSLSCQLYTSHKIISQIVQQGRILPLKYIPNEQDSFEKIANTNVRFLIDINYLAKLCQNANLKYFEYHFDQGNAADLANYRKKAEEDFNASIDYYGIEMIYFDKIIKILTALQKSPVLQKMIKDLYKYCIEYKVKILSSKTPFIPQERTLSLCIFFYLKGDISDLENQEQCKKLMKIMGVSDTCYLQHFKILLDRLQFSMNFCARVLSSQKQKHRFYTFYSFTYKKNKLLLSLDMNLYRVLSCLFKSKQLGEKSTHVGDFLHFLKQIDIFPRNRIQSEDDCDKRNKILMQMAEKMGLITELACTNTWQLVLWSCLQESRNHSKQFIRFYSQLLQRTGKIQIQRFKILKDVFVHEQQVFEQFIKDYTTQSSSKNKISLSNNNGISPICIQYFHSRCNFAQQVIGIESTSLKLVPFSPEESQNKINEVYNSRSINEIIEVLKEYVAFLKVKKKEEEHNTFNKLVIELIKIRILMENNKQIDEFLRTLSVDPRVRQILNVKTQQVITELLPKQESITQLQFKHSESKQQEEKYKKLKAKQIAKRKMQQMKVKQQKVANSMQAQQIQIKDDGSQNKSKNDGSCIKGQDDRSCIICKDSNEKSSLFHLAFIERSNLYSKLYKTNEQGEKLNTQSHMVISSCYHLIHVECFIKVNKERHYSYCALCKSPANIYIPFDLSPKALEERTAINVSRQRIEVINAVLKAKVKNKPSENTSKGMDAEVPIQDQLLQSIINVGLSVALIRPQFYDKKLKKIYQKVLSMYCGIIGQDQKFEGRKKLVQEKINQKIVSLQKAISNKDDSSVTLVKNAQVYFAQRIFTELFGKQESVKFIDLSANLCNQIKNIVESLVDKTEFLETASLQHNWPNKIDSILSCPITLKQLSVCVGRCPQCYHATNQLYLCFICRWKGCHGCQKKKVVEHAKQVHEGTTAFIRVDNGKVVYISYDKGHLENSIYENFIGEPYKDGISARQKYNLNKEKNRQVRQKIILSEIQKYIRYEQNMKNKVFNTFDL